MISTFKPSLAGLQILRRCTVVIASSLALCGPLASAETDNSAEVPSILKSTPRQYEVSQLVAKFAERAHYSRSVIDDRLSNQLWENDIDDLDSGKHYFLRPDIAYFSKYRYELDDTLMSGDMEPVFDIFRLYRLRAQQQLTYAIGLLDKKPDFEIDEYYVFDRNDMPWPADTAEIHELWRQRTKNDLLNLALTDKTHEEGKQVLTKRYQQVLKRINQLDADDVLANPEGMLRALCGALDISFAPAMLSWPAGRRDSDGLWAAHWYGAVEQSTGFAAPNRAARGVPDHLTGLLAAADEIYQALRPHRLTAS